MLTRAFVREAFQQDLARPTPSETIRLERQARQQAWDSDPAAIMTFGQLVSGATAIARTDDPLAWLCAPLLSHNIALVLERCEALAPAARASWYDHRTDLLTLATILFFQGADEELIALPIAEAVPIDRVDRLQAHAIHTLALARLTRDIPLALGVVHDLARGIRQHKLLPAHRRLFSCWDWYALAYELALVLERPLLTPPPLAHLVPGNLGRRRHVITKLQALRVPILFWQRWSRPHALPWYTVVEVRDRYHRPLKVSDDLRLMIEGEVGDATDIAGMGLNGEFSLHVATRMMRQHAIAYPHFAPELYQALPPPPMFAIAPHHQPYWRWTVGELWART